MSRELPVELQGSSQKTKIKLSEKAEEVINEDIQNFMLETNLTGFFNHLFEVLFNHSEACIDYEIEKKKQQYLSVLEQEAKKTGVKSAEQMELVASAIAESDRAALIYKYTKGLKEKPSSDKMHIIRLSNSAYGMLYSGEVNWNNSGAYKTVRAYLEALIESYAEKSACERELLFFSPSIAQIKQVLNEPIRSRSSLIIDFRSASGAAPAEKAEGVSGRAKAEDRLTGSVKRYVIVPYCLEPDKDNNYYYLAGMSRPLGDPNLKLLPTSFRISRIEAVKLTDLVKGIKRTDEEELRTRIDKKGIQYIFSWGQEESDIRVRLTEEGMRKYRKILHNRPSFRSAVSTEDGCVDMIFNQSATQVSYYFLQFGKDAVILSPEWLKEKMENIYLEAAKAYRETCENTEN